MISVLWLVIVLVLWVVFLTALLPITLAMLVSQKARNLMFLYIFLEIFGTYILPLLVPVRRRAFRLLQEHLKGRDESKPLKVVELGIGPGFNLEFYPPNSHLTAVDKNPKFEVHFLGNARQYPEVFLERAVHQPAEDMSDIPNHSADVVVSTYLHCSCTSSRDIMREVKRILKPGGKYLFVDHISHQRGTLGFYAQKIFNPLYTMMSNGCQLDKDAELIARQAGFTDLHCEYYHIPKRRNFLFKQVIGVATT